MKGEREILEELGTLIDEGLGELFDVLVLVSDHGFRVYRRVVNVNVALAEAGLLRFTSDPKRAPPHYGTTLIPWGRTVRVSPRVVQVLRTLHLEGIARKAKDIVERVTGRRVRIRQSIYPDWHSSKALVTYNSFGVILRDPAVFDRVVKVLSEVEGLRLVEPSEKYDPGPYAERYPHIIVLPDFDAGYMISRAYSEVVVEEGLVSHHHPDGTPIIHPVDVLIDNGFSPDVHVKRVTPPVIGALIYALLGLPVQRGAARAAAEKLLGVNLSQADYTARWIMAKRVAGILAGR